MVKQNAGGQRGSIVNQGDIFWVDLDPTKGHEQSGHRPVMVISKRAFNNRMNGLAIVLPITTGGNFISNLNFGVDLPTGMRTRGMIICCHPTMIDLPARGARFIEAAPNHVVQDALARLHPVIF